MHDLGKMKGARELLGVESPDVKNPQWNIYG